ncbi:MAG: alanine--glyoxylate aminotransferase family protein [Opitutales bacterium]|nr:alanine--glyoxylate aminotransferase family protein [Opitutales bacterium]
MSYKLYIPGPVEVSEKTYQALTTHIIGHRSQDFVALYDDIQPKLQTLFSTTSPVFLSTSSAWGVMEGSIRNLVQKKALCCMCGAFSDKWLEVAHRCGKQADGYQVEWGKALEPEAIRKYLQTGEYDCITMVHNETSTGVMNPLKEIMDVVREFPEVISVVDTVSSFSAVPILTDEWGIDVVLTGCQKALAIPPGLALFTASDRALARAAQVEGRGYYFDFVEFKKNHDKSMTPSTPVLPHIFALKSKLEDIFEEGLEARYARHEKTNAMVHEWMTRNGFELFPEKQFASKTLTTVSNNRNIDMNAFNKRLKERFQMVINTGYGKIKGVTFRISNMGDETEETIGELVRNLDAVLEEFTS